MITERYTRWVAMLAQSDANLVLLAAIAVVVVIAWEWKSVLPHPWTLRAAIAFFALSLMVFITVALGRPLTLGQVLWIGFSLSFGIQLSLIVIRWRAARKKLARQ